MPAIVSTANVSRPLMLVALLAGTMFAATIKDIALQLNYHSIHHRAQMQTIIRSQGLEPEFVDYIGTKYRRVQTATA